VVTTFLFLFFYEGDILYVVQNMLAEGKTHYDDTIGAILITLVMYLIHLFIVAVTGLRTVGFGLTFFPSILLLSLLVLLRPETNVRLSYIVVASLLTLLFLFGVWFCRQMSSIPTKDTEKFKFLKSLWVDLTLIIIPIILLWGLTDASDVYHHRVRSERLILAGRAADVIDVGRNTKEIDKSLTTLRIYSMAVSGQLGDSLFTIPINIKGVKQGDYAMILGYPGSTDRYSTSYTVKNLIESDCPAIINCRTTKLNEYRKHMDADQEVFIKYASKQAGVSNYWKYAIGQQKQLVRNHVYDRRLEQEKDFREWVFEDPSRQMVYGDIFDQIQEKWAILDDIVMPMTYLREAGWNGGEAVSFSRRFIRINNMLNEKASKEDIAKVAEGLKAQTATFFKDYDKALDMDVTIALLNLFYKDIDRYVPLMIAEIGAKNNGDFTEWVTKAFEKSIFVDQAKLENWLEKPKKLDKDPIFALTMDIISTYANVVYPLYEEAGIIGNAGERLYMKGLMEMQTERNFYPDANFTMRLTYGTVEPYKGADAVNYNYYTTMDGVMAKYIPGNWEFDIPQDVRDLYEARDYGRYADENGQLIVNFITTNDITGGNSGSPVINGEGELIGLAFDGNWEAMSGDIMFEQKVQRTICMDARYLLWCLEKVGGVKNIIDELTIIE